MYSLELAVETMNEEEAPKGSDCQKHPETLKAVAEKCDGLWKSVRKEARLMVAYHLIEVVSTGIPR